VRLTRNWDALSDEFKAQLPNGAVWNLRAFCEDIVLSGARGWEGYFLSSATRSLWRALDIFSEMDPNDIEALGDGFLDDLCTALTPLEQIANGDYFVN
jgi:hypothetical protein